MLPPGAKVIIMDEGHEVSDIARNFQEKRYHHKMYNNHIDLLSKAAERTLDDRCTSFMYDIGWDEIQHTLTEMMVKLTHEYKKKPDPYRQFWIMDYNARTRLQEFAKGHIQAIESAHTTIEGYLEKFQFSPEKIQYFQEAYGDEFADWLLTMYQTSDFLFGKQKLLEYIFAFDETLSLNEEEIFWLEPFHDNYVSVHAKPLTGAGFMESYFDSAGEEEKKVPILMSATLAAGGGSDPFKHVKKSLGIHESLKINQLTVTSPFNLSENLLWYLPAETPEAIGANKRVHTPFILNEMKNIIMELGGKTLCLFTSIEGMKLSLIHI